MAGRVKESRAQARERIAAERRAEAAAQKRRERALRIGLTAVVVVIVTVIGIAVVVSRKSSVDTSAPNPTGVTATYGYPVGTASKPVVDIYEDLQCPVCKNFESKLGSTMEQLATDGKVRLVYHTMTFLDELNTSSFPADVAKSSTRAANAAACAQDQGKFLAYHDVVYANQPTTEGTGYTDAQLTQFAKDAGVPDMTTFSACMTSGKYDGFLTKVAAEADARQVTGTPTIFVAGKMITLNNDFLADDKKTILDAITAAS